MGQSLFTPPPVVPQGWIDVASSMIIRYSETVLTTVVSKYSKYVYLTPKTIHWKAGFTQPAGVSGSFILGVDLPLPAAPLPSAAANGFMLGSVTMVRPGSWYAQGTAVLIPGAIYGNAQRAVFYSDTNLSNLMGQTGGQPATFAPGDQFWWDATYEIA